MLHSMVALYTHTHTHTHTHTQSVVVTAKGHAGDVVRQQRLGFGRRTRERPHRPRDQVVVYAAVFGQQVPGADFRAVHDLVVGVSEVALGTVK